MKKRFERLDRWLCVYLKPWRLRLWWQRLWIRRDEFHPSLNRDASIVFSIAKSRGWSLDCKAVCIYDADLTRRRDFVHERTLNMNATRAAF